MTLEDLTPEQLDELYRLEYISADTTPVNTMVTPQVVGAGGGLGRFANVVAKQGSRDASSQYLDEKLPQIPVPNFEDFMGYRPSTETEARQVAARTAKQKQDRYVQTFGPQPEILSREDALAKAQKHYEFRSPSGQKEDWLTSLSRAFSGFGAAAHGFGGDGSHALNFMSGEDARNKEIAEADLARMVGEQDLADSLLQESIKNEAAWKKGFYDAGTDPFAQANYNPANDPSAMSSRDDEYRDAVAAAQEAWVARQTKVVEAGGPVGEKAYATTDLTEEGPQSLSQDSPEWLEVALPTLRSITDRLNVHATSEMAGEWKGVTNYLGLQLAQGTLSKKELNKWLDFGLKLQSLTPEELQNAKNMQAIINKMREKSPNSDNR